MPSPGLVFEGCILVHDGIALCRELDVVGVVEHHEVAEPEGTCHTACALRDLLLDTSIRYICIYGLFFKSRIACARCKEFGSHCRTYSKHMSLPERS